MLRVVPYLLFEIEERNLMKWIIVLLIVGFFVWRMMPTKGVGSISTDELKGMLKDKSKQFLDVRTAGEYNGRHIKQFKNIPLNTLNSQLGNFDKSKEVIVICQSGMRSAKAANILKRSGYEKVTNVKGGMAAWRN